MASSYGVRQLYGGAMTVELPADWIDASDLRQIPDHQEVFLSPTTLTSTIFEINTYFESTQIPSIPQAQTQAPQTIISTNANGSTTTSSITTGSSTSQNQSELDNEAARFHFTDVIQPPDTLVTPLPPAQPVKMVDPSLSPFSASMLAGNITDIDPRNPRGPSSHRGPAPGPPGFTTTANNNANSSRAHAHSAEPFTETTHQLQLLIRLPQKKTDLVVRVNIPLKEFANAGQASGSSDSDSGLAEGMAAAELAKARDLIARVVGTLSVKSWRLFGEE